MLALVLLLFFLQASDPSAEGMKALDAQKYEQAAELFGKAVAADPKDYAAHFHLALSFSMLKRDPEAVTEYKKALELKPGLYEAELNIGILLIRDQQARRSGFVFAGGGRAEAQGIPTAGVLGRSAAQSGDAAKAEEAYRAALELNAKSAAAELGLAQRGSAAEPAGGCGAAFSRGRAAGCRVIRTRFWNWRRFTKRTIRMPRPSPFTRSSRRIPARRNIWAS